MKILKNFLYAGLIALPLLLPIFLAGCGEIFSPSDDTDIEPNTIVTEVPSYNLEDIGNHASESDCWLLIQGKVYNVTDYVGNHPGGAALLEGCGTDATELFETRPMGSGTPHSANARSLLDDYYIGDFAS